MSSFDTLYLISPLFFCLQTCLQINPDTVGGRSMVLILMVPKDMLRMCKVRQVSFWKLFWNSVCRSKQTLVLICKQTWLLLLKFARKKFIRAKYFEKRIIFNRRTVINMFKHISNGSNLIFLLFIQSVCRNFKVYSHILFLR